MHNNYLIRFCRKCLNKSSRIINNKISQLNSYCSEKKELEAKGFFEAYSRENETIKLHLGCGGYAIPGWFNTDLNSDNKNNIFFLDMLRKFYINDNTVDCIYSEHNIEHFKFKDAYQIFKECYRILKPGGILRVATPSLKKIIDFYLIDNNLHDRYLTFQIEKFNQDCAELDFYKKALAFNGFFRNWGHLTIFDKETLELLFQRVGFSQIKECEICSSEHESLASLELHRYSITDDFNTLETIVMEGRK